MTVTCVAVASMRLLFGMCDCTVDSSVGKGYFSLVLGILHVYGQLNVRSHVSPGVDCLLRFLKRAEKRTEESA